MTAVADEIQVSGREIGIALVKSLGTFQSHSAARNSWHKHRMFELLFLLEGSTVYEFPDRKTVELPGGRFLVIPPGIEHRGLHNVRMPSTLCGIVFHPRLDGALANTPFTARDLKWMAKQFDGAEFDCGFHGNGTARTAAMLCRELRRHTSRRDDPSAAPALRLLACTAILESARQVTANGPREFRQVLATAIAYMEQRFRRTRFAWMTWLKRSVADGQDSSRCLNNRPE